MLDAAHARRADILWLALAALVLIATGLGLRDPWPADEPRFALIAQDMVLSGDWLFPRVGGDLYADKPPLYFWVLGLAYFLTGSLRASFLIPSFLSACGVLWLVYDLARRLFGTRAAFAAAGTLACTIQFVVAARAAQIDMTLCFLTTLSLYGLLRHLLIGPAWRWYFVGGLAAGLGVITKGVGFLPLLILLPYFVARSRAFGPLPSFPGGARWAGAPLGFVLGISIWLVPMLIAVATRNDPQLTMYRDEILFQQTINRYADAWHHVQPWYYFLLEVIPPSWIPFSVLLIPLVPEWKQAWRRRDARVWLPLAWMLLVLLFFSLSSGKRGIYVLPALPALALAAAPFLPQIFTRLWVRRASLALAAVLVVLALAAVVALILDIEPMRSWLSAAGLETTLGAAAMGLVSLIMLVAWLVIWRWRPLLAWPALLACLAIAWSYLIAPALDSERSARGFMEDILTRVPPETTLGVAAYKEQFLLHLNRPVVTFGHARWREGSAEVNDAAAWLNAAPDRILLLPQRLQTPCFAGTKAIAAGRTSDEDWVLVYGPADVACAVQGDVHRAIRYVPPGTNR